MATKQIAHNLNSKWRSQDVKIQESADFTSLLLSNKVLAGLKQAGYQSPSPIQIEAIPVGRFGKDLVVQAKSGTGKTLVFSIIALEMILPEVSQPQVLIIAPTREIAHQICSVIQAVGSGFETLNCCTFIGGIPISDDKENISGCQIAVGTPGRIKQLIKEGVLKTNCIRLFVLDEADQLLENSFLNDVDEIFLTLPKDKQVIATSATYPQKLKKLSDRYFRNPYLARLNIDELALLGIVHYVQTIDVSDMPMLVYQKKLEYLAKILTSISFSQCLVFCNLLSKVPQLTSDIKDWGFTTTSISSSKEQVDRLKAIDKLKLFKCKVLVSSDLTSRGIDAENVNLVVNFDLPHSTETYLHRVGRAGRYGSRGLAVTLLLPKQSDTYKAMQSSSNFMSYDLPDPIPQNLMNIRPEGFKELKDGFETSSESSATGNQNGGNGVEDTASSVCSENERVASDFFQKQHEQSDANTEINSDQFVNSENGLSSDENGLGENNGSMEEKLGSLENTQKGNIDSDVCNELNSPSDEYEKVDSPENVKFENPPEVGNDGKGTETLPKDGSSSNEMNQELLADVTSFLAQMQSSVTDSHSGNEAKESLDSFYYQVFKSFADENIPVTQNEAVSSGETAVESKPLENISDDVREPVEKQTEKSECNKVSKKHRNKTYSESSSSDSDHDFDFPKRDTKTLECNTKSNSTSSSSDSYQDCNFPKRAAETSKASKIRSSSSSSDSESLYRLSNLNYPVGKKFPFQSDYMAKGADGWKLVELDSSKDTEVPEIKEDTFKVHSSTPHRVLERNPMPRNLTNASLARSGKSANRVPISRNSEDGHSQNRSTGSHSPRCGRGNRTSKGPKYCHSQGFQANSVGLDQRAHNSYPQHHPHHNYHLQYDQAQNHVQAHPVCNWHLEPEANGIHRSCQEAFNVGYNCSYPSSSASNCSHHRSHITCSHTNSQNHHPHDSGYHSSSNQWYDMFSQQWQQINNMCYSHPFHY